VEETTQARRKDRSGFVCGGGHRLAGEGTFSFPFPARPPFKQPAELMPCRQAIAEFQNNEHE
jgi:hypothetical protein